jgi:hypothetical protein
MDKTKRKVYQARGHLLKAEAILKELLTTETDPVVRPHLDRARYQVAISRRKVYDYIFKKWGNLINLEAYK